MTMLMMLSCENLSDFTFVNWHAAESVRQKCDSLSGTRTPPPAQQEGVHVVDICRGKPGLTGPACARKQNLPQTAAPVASTSPS